MRVLVFVSILLAASLLAGCFSRGPQASSDQPSGSAPLADAPPPDHEAVSFEVVRPDQSLIKSPARLLHPLIMSATGFEGGEPTVRSTGTALLLTGNREVLRSEDDVAWSSVQQHRTTADPVLAWDPVLHQAVKADLDTSLACALVSTSSADGKTWTQQAPACSATMDYLKVAAGPPGPSANPLAGPSVTYLCHNAAPPANPCLVSQDGAASFHTPSLPLPPSPCGGVTSYPVVAPSGVVVLPVHGLCGPDFYVSRDSGLQWTLLPGPGDHLSRTFAGSMTSADFDGDRMVASWETDGGIALAWTDDLQSWAGPFVVSVPGAIVRFNAMQAGNGTVVLAFLGAMESVWSLYVVELDQASLEGAAYRLLDPVQRGDICYDGARCASARNLGDFITSTTDRGDFVVAWTDGCLSCPASGQSNDDVLAVARLRLGTL